MAVMHSLHSWSTSASSVFPMKFNEVGIDQFKLFTAVFLLLIYHTAHFIYFPCPKVVLLDHHSSQSRSPSNTVQPVAAPGSRWQKEGSTKEANQHLFLLLPNRPTMGTPPLPFRHWMGSINTVGGRKKEASVLCMSSILSARVITHPPH